MISEGLPASRVVALLTGFDGGVVTSLRGVAAWLAALSEGARRDLIERDPISVMCYGDVSRFMTEHRRALFRALIREASQLNSEIWNATLTGAITTPDMEPELRAFLECRDQVDRAQVEFVLDAVGHGQHLPGLSDSLFDILYDCQMLPLKGMAVAAFVYHCTDDDYRSKKLQQLLADITTNNVEDSRGSKTGRLFERGASCKNPEAATIRDERGCQRLINRDRPTPSVVPCVQPKPT